MVKISINNEPHVANDCGCSACVAAANLREVLRPPRRTLGFFSGMVPYVGTGEDEGELVDWFENRRGNGRASNQQSLFDWAPSHSFIYLLDLMAMTKPQLERHLKKKFVY